MTRPPGVVEDLDTVRRIPIGRLWGVKLTITPLTWLGPIIYFGLGLALTLLRPGMGLVERISDALVFSLAVEITIVLHALGHIISGKMVRSAMDELLIMSTRDITLYYGDQSVYPPSVHIARALGGPVLNLVLAGLFHLLLVFVPDGTGRVLIEQLAATNTFFGVGGLLPIPSIDGEVVWRELLKSRSGAR